MFISYHWTRACVWTSYYGAVAVLIKIRLWTCTMFLNCTRLLAVSTGADVIQDNEEYFSL